MFWVVSLKDWYLSPYGITTQNTITDIFTAVRTSDLTFKFVGAYILFPAQNLISYRQEYLQ